VPPSHIEKVTDAVQFTAQSATVPSTAGCGEPPKQHVGPVDDMGANRHRAPLNWVGTLPAEAVVEAIVEAVLEAVPADPPDTGKITGAAARHDAG
jgi:hypothetical protein